MKSIYVLKDSQGNIFYVGKTKNTSNRFNEHKRRFAHRRPFTLEVVETIDQDKAYLREQCWIANLLLEGHLLLNSDHNPTN